MRKIKVSEATGSVLDWMVLLAQYGAAVTLDEDLWIVREGIADMPLDAYTPSTDWSQGGPILSKLGTENGLQLTTHVTSTAAACGWRASCDFPNGFYFGETALIAAMRCYVASKLGNEVEVPEGLYHGA